MTSQGYCARFSKDRHPLFELFAARDSGSAGNPERCASLRSYRLRATPDAVHAGPILISRLGALPGPAAKCPDPMARALT